MSTIINAAPFANLLGIQDLSGRPPVQEPEAIPTHLPHLYLYAQKGPTTPQLVSGDEFLRTYGAKTLDTRSPYYNHQSVLANILQGKANSLMVQRVIPTDAGPKSRLLLSIEIVEDDIPQYQRGSNGKFLLDANGARIPVSGGAVETGYKARWVLNDWTAGATVEGFGAVSTKVGTMTATVGGAQAQVYPILELEADSIGGDGNNLGLRLSAPTTDSSSPVNSAVAENINAALYRLTLVQRTDATSTANIVETLNGEPTMDFTFKPGAINKLIDQQMSLEDIFIDAYQDLETQGFPPIRGPFGRLKVYDDNLLEVLQMVATTEGAFDLVPEEAADDPEYSYLVNLLTGKDIHGVPYYTYELQGASGGGLVFSDMLSTTMMAAGGSDGTMNDTAFDLLVRNELANYGDLEADLLDDAIYPQSCWYDTGFKLDTKLAAMTILGRRKDMWLALSTQDITMPQNTETEEVSIAISLKTAARNFPESELYGTPVCRAIVFNYSGYLIGSKYKKLLPLTIEFASKCAEYMSAGNGIWRPGYGYDLSPQNQIRLFRKVNCVFKPMSQRVRDWNNGMVWVQNFDRRSTFWPAVQTVYDDDSSVLNSAINMMIAVDLQKVAQRTWRELTGNSSLTAEQFRERSNRLIAEKVQGKYDGRVVVIPETYYTRADEQRGYSWSCKIHMYAPTMRTVGTFTVVAHRIEDLPGPEA